MNPTTEWVTSVVANPCWVVNVIGAAAGQCTVRKAAAAKMLMVKVAVESATIMMVLVLMVLVLMQLSFAVFRGLSWLRLDMSMNV